MTYNRRAALMLSGNLAAVAALALVPGCTMPAGATTLQMAQTYGDDLVAALLAAASTYQASPNPSPIVASVVADLQTAKKALDSATLASDARGVVLQIIAAAQTILPMLTPFLAAAGPYVPLAIAVLQAFVAALPPPPATPPTPPAALHAVAERYRAAHP